MAEAASAVAPGVVVPAASKQPGSLYAGDQVVTEWINILKWCLIPILLFTVYWAVEKYLLRSQHRLVPNPAEFPCRIFGFSHYVVGMMFMLTSKKMRKAVGWVWFVGLLAVGVLISLVFTHFGGTANPIMVSFYFLFFMIHGFRDMVFFYKPPAGNPALERSQSMILILIQAFLFLSLMYVLVPAYLLHLRFHPRSLPPDLQSRVDALTPYLNAILGWSWTLLLATLVGLWWLFRKFPAGFGGFWKADRPVMLVLLSSVLIILASPLVGPWTYNLLILSHFVGWYFYASRRLATIPKQAARADGLWKWCRSSVVGFKWLHLGAAAAIGLLIVVNHYFFRNAGVLNTLFSGKAFYYWTVLHVSISFSPRS